MRLNYIDRLEIRMVGDRRIEIRFSPTAKIAIDKKIGIGTLRGAIEPPYLAIHVDILIQLHLLPVFEPRLISLRIDGAPVDVRIANGLKQNPLDGLALG